MSEGSAERSKQIEKFYELAQDEARLQKLGHNVVVEAIRNAAEERLGTEISNPMVTITSRGPTEASQGWTNLIIWSRSWSKSAPSIVNRPGIGDPYTDPQAPFILTERELQILNSLGILEEQ